MLVATFELQISEERLPRNRTMQLNPLPYVTRIQDGRTSARQSDAWATKTKKGAYTACRISRCIPLFYTGLIPYTIDGKKLNAIIGLQLQVQSNPRYRKMCLQPCKLPISHENVF